MLTSRKHTPATPKNNTGKLHSTNRAATPRFFSPGFSSCSHNVVSVKPRTDSAAKPNKSKPMRKPTERSRVRSLSVADGDAEDVRVCCTWRLSTVRPTVENRRLHSVTPRRAPPNGVPYKGNHKEADDSTPRDHKGNKHCSGRPSPYFSLRLTH